MLLKDGLDGNPAMFLADFRVVTKKASWGLSQVVMRELRNV